MASLPEKVEAELEQMDQALRELPGARRVKQLTVYAGGKKAAVQVARQGRGVNKPSDRKEG